MDEDNNNSIETVQKDKQQGQNGGGVKNAVKNGAKKVGEKSKQLKKWASKLKSLPAILPALGIILLVILIVGLIASIISMPGMFLGNIKEAAISVWNEICTFFDGAAVERAVSEEDEIELAQRIHAMGYDIVGSGFSDVTAYDEDGTPTEFANFSDGKNYLRAYLIANESTYTIAQWSISGEWQNFFNFITTR